MELYLFLTNFSLKFYLHISEFFRTFAENLKESFMAPKITLVKNYRNKETLRLVEMQELA